MAAPEHLFVVTFGEARAVVVSVGTQRRLFSVCQKAEGRRPSSFKSIIVQSIIYSLRSLAAILDIPPLAPLKNAFAFALAAVAVLPPASRTDCSRLLGAFADDPPGATRAPPRSTGG